MSLAMLAAPVDDTYNISLPMQSDANDNYLTQKRHKKTQRRYPKVESFDTKKVNSMLQELHSHNGANDDIDDTFRRPMVHNDNNTGNNHTGGNNDTYGPNTNNAASSFAPPPNPVSAGVQKTITREPPKEPFSIFDTKRYAGKAPLPNYENTDNLDLNDYANYGDETSNDAYYRRVIPGYKPSIRPRASASAYTTGTSPSSSIAVNDYSQDAFMQKINYMITLLEEKQDERTNNVTEEVILYSFLGVFIIFIADTFVRAGKYVR